MMIIKDYVSNAAVLIALISLSSLLYKQFFTAASEKLQHMVLFCLVVIAGWTSMYFGIDAGASSIIDFRLIPVLAAVIFIQKPFFILAAGLAIGFARFSFGFNEAAVAGFWNVVVLAFIGAMLSIIGEKWSFQKKAAVNIVFLNAANAIFIAGFSSVTFMQFLPAAFFMNLLFSFLIVWMIQEMYSDYKSKQFLMESAQKDSLTKLYNRRSFLRFYKQYMAGKKGDGSFAIVFIDIDFFKKVNDLYGHIIGDRVLQAVSGRIENSLRSIDIVARYGGEEFVVILPSCTKESAVTIMERVLEKVAAHPIQINELSIPITLSAGVAAAPEYAPEQLLKLADEALYEAKKSGRNKIVTANLKTVS